MRHTQYKHDRWKVWRLVAYFRLLVWWGAERLQEVSKRCTPMKLAEQRIKQDIKYPRSEWVPDENFNYCFLGTTDETNFKIIRMYPWINN